MAGSTHEPAPQVDGRTLRYAHRRQELLDGATEYLLEQGVRDLSLRPVADALGISHASLLRHFTSKEDLVLAVLVNIRRRVTLQLESAAASAGSNSVADVIRSAWRVMSEPREQRQFHLLFELSDVRRQSASPEIADALVSGWVDLIGGLLEAEGSSAANPETQATLLLAQVRGLQLDLLLTGERDRVDRAFELAVAAV